MIFSSSFSFCLLKSWSLSLNREEESARKMTTTHWFIIISVFLPLTYTAAPPRETDPCSPWSAPAGFGFAASECRFGRADGDFPPPGCPSADSATEHHTTEEAMYANTAHPNRYPRSAFFQYLALVAELCAADIQLLELLLQLVEIGLQPGVLQLGLVQLTLQLLVICCQQLVVVKELTVCLIQPSKKKKKKKNTRGWSVEVHVWMIQ